MEHDVDPDELELHVDRRTAGRSRRRTSRSGRRPRRRAGARARATADGRARDEPGEGGDTDQVAQDREEREEARRIEGTGVREDERPGPRSPRRPARSTQPGRGSGHGCAIHAAIVASRSPAMADRRARARLDIERLFAMMAGQGGASDQARRRAQGQDPRLHRGDAARPRLSAVGPRDRARGRARLHVGRPSPPPDPRARGLPGARRRPVAGHPPHADRRDAPRAHQRARPAGDRRATRVVVPIIGEIAAGGPIEAYQDADGDRWPSRTSSRRAATPTSCASAATR